MKEKDLVSVRVIPNTSLREEMKVMSRSVTGDFVEDLKMGDLEIVSQRFLEGTKYITPANIYTVFTEWVDAGNMKTLSLKKFTQEFGEKVGKSCRKTFNKRQVRCYNLTSILGE